MNKIYCDWAATAKPFDECITRFIEVSSYYYNPSSNYSKEESNILNNSRSTIAKLLGIESNQIVFTSCATESNAIIMQTILNRPSKSRVLIGSSSHPSLQGWKNALLKQGFDVLLIKNSLGIISKEDIVKNINSNTTHIALTYVNSLNGSILDLEPIVKAIRKAQTRPIHIHLDAVQALAHIPINFDIVDSVSLSLHKIGGLKGQGILYVKDKNFLPFVSGGGQENNKRGGTENLAGIASNVVALEKAFTNMNSVERRLKDYKSYLINKIKDHYNIYSPLETTSNHILAVSHKFLPSEVIVRMLLEDNILAASGSACSKNSKLSNASYFLEMGITSKDAKNMIRISLGYATTKDEVEHIAKALIKRVKL